MTKAHDKRCGYRKSTESAEKGAMWLMAQIRTTVKFDQTKTNKRSEREGSRAELMWHNKTQS